MIGLFVLQNSELLMMASFLLEIQLYNSEREYLSDVLSNMRCVCFLSLTNCLCCTIASP